MKPDQRDLTEPLNVDSAFHDLISYYLPTHAIPWGSIFSNFPIGKYLYVNFYTPLSQTEIIALIQLNNHQL